MIIIKMFIIIICMVLNWGNSSDQNSFNLIIPNSVESASNSYESDSTNTNSASVFTQNSSGQDLQQKQQQDPQKQVVQKTEKKSVQWLSTWITAIIAVVVSLFIPYAVYLVQQMARKSQEFQAYAKSLYSDNPIEQASAAILLRSFLKKQKIGVFMVSFDCTREAKNILISLLKTPISTTLQKNLADGFSYANNLDGHDMQYINMVGALIKPLSRIAYEETKKEKHKNNRLSMKHADFFHAVVQECSINNVDASDAIFKYSILCGTSFKNCILTKAKFDDANISRVVFDEDCELEGASFKGAIGIKEAKVHRRVKEENKSIRRKKEDEVIEKHNLIEYLDNNGVFHKVVNEQYKPKEKHIRIFVSKLGIMNPYQKMHHDSIINKMINKGFDIDTIERQNYMTTSQLTDVASHLEKSDGCIVSAFEYLQVDKGTIHKDVEGDDNQIIEDTVFASPWQHIETALANGKQMPCLIICDKNLRRDGMFDEAIVNPDKNLFILQYSDDTQSWEPTLTNWIGSVMEYHSNRNKD